MTSYRTTYRGESVGTAATQRLILANHSHKLDELRRRGSAAAAPGVGARVLVTRGGLGERNARFALPAAERTRRGAVNPTSDGRGGRCTESGVLPEGGYITATRRDSFGDEGSAPTETDRHYHRDATGARVECPHADC